jgi:hypothetical protein
MMTIAATISRKLMVWGLILLPAAGLLCAGPSPAAIPAATGLVGLWDFNDSLADCAGESSRAKDDFTTHGAAGAAILARMVHQAIAPDVSGQALALGVEPGDAAFLTAPLSADTKLGAR